MKFLKFTMVLLVPLLLLASFVVLATGAVPYKVYVIHTGSMSPHIPSGSAVLVREGQYHVGEVITFTEDGLTVTHRLVSINSRGVITTKGDANATNDPWHVPQRQIIGGVVAAPRYVGYWITYLKNPLGLSTVLLAALALWQIWALSAGVPERGGQPVRDSRRERTTAHLTATNGLTVVGTRRRMSKRAALVAEQRRVRYAKLFGTPVNANAAQKVGVR